MRLSHDAARLPRLLAAERHEDESDLLAVVRVFRRRWRYRGPIRCHYHGGYRSGNFACDTALRAGRQARDRTSWFRGFFDIHDDLAASDNDYVETQVLNLLSESLAISTIREFTPRSEAGIYCYPATVALWVADVSSPA